MPHPGNTFLVAFNSTDRITLDIHHGNEADADPSVVTILADEDRITVHVHLPDDIDCTMIHDHEVVAERRAGDSRGHAGTRTSPPTPSPPAATPPNRPSGEQPRPNRRGDAEPDAEPGHPVRDFAAAPEESTAPSSVVDQVPPRPLTAAEIEARIFELGEVIPLHAPHRLAEIFDRRQCLSAVPADRVAEALSELTTFCGMRVMRVHDGDCAHLSFEDPTGARCYEVDGDLLSWLYGESASHGEPGHWVGEVIEHYTPATLVEIGPYDYRVPGSTDQEGQ
ncbi:hypothetical protein ACTD5D_40355 [Nocardia takedensis]|uniref:hypothetical protein n=1 Tax=Nocardia takedensis TaxID=259390 RepID=UPI003F758948